MQILDTNPKLCFRLQQQKMIELIRRKVEDALELSQEELAPRAEENVHFFRSSSWVLLLFSSAPLSDSLFCSIPYLFLCCFCIPVYDSGILKFGNEGEGEEIHQCNYEYFALMCSYI